MGEILSELKKRRTILLLANIIYFLILLILGLFILVRGRRGIWYVAVAVTLLAYIFLIRPMISRYRQAIRREIIKNGVCREMEKTTYDPKAGFTVEEFRASGLVNTVSDKAFLSREKVSGRMGRLQFVMADVTFPIRENGRNAMSNGLYLKVTGENAEFPILTVRAGQTDNLQIQEKAASLLKEMTSFIPGNLYIQSQPHELHLFFRGRFVCFHVNPLMNITDNTLKTNPLPELQQSLQLAQALMI